VSKSDEAKTLFQKLKLSQKDIVIVTNRGKPMAARMKTIWKIPR